MKEHNSHDIDNVNCNRYVYDSDVVMLIDGADGDSS